MCAWVPWSVGSVRRPSTRPCMHARDASRAVGLSRSCMEDIGGRGRRRRLAAHMPVYICMRTCVCVCVCWHTGKPATCPGFSRRRDEKRKRGTPGPCEFANWSLPPPALWGERVLSTPAYCSHSADALLSLFVRTPAFFLYTDQHGPFFRSAALSRPHSCVLVLGHVEASFAFLKNLLALAILEKMLLFLVTSHYRSRVNFFLSFSFITLYLRVHQMIIYWK